MADTIICPGCRQRYPLGANLYGKEVRCKKCGRTFLVPPQLVDDEPVDLGVGNLLDQEYAIAGPMAADPFAGSPAVASLPVTLRPTSGGRPTAADFLRRVADHKLATIVAVVAVANLVMLLALGQVFSALTIFGAFGIGVSLVGFRRDEGRPWDTLLSWGTILLFSLVILAQAIAAFVATDELSSGPQIVGRIGGLLIGMTCSGVFLLLIPALLFRSFGFFRPAAGFFLVLASLQFAVVLLAASVAANRGLLANWNKGWGDLSASAQGERDTSDGDWVEFSWPPGRFTTQFPGRPIQRRNPVDPRLDDVFYDAGEIAYMVTYGDLPPTTTSADTVLDGSVADLAKRAKLLETGKVTLSGTYPGRRAPYARFRRPYARLAGVPRGRPYVSDHGHHQGSREICRRDAQVPAVP